MPIGICAWVMGGRDLRKMKNKEMDPQGQGQTQAGWICGIVGTILDSLALLACLGYFGFIGYMIQSTASNVQKARTIQQQQGPAAPPQGAPVPPPAPGPAKGKMKSVIKDEAKP